MSNLNSVSDLPKSRLGMKSKRKYIDGTAMNYEVIDEILIPAQSSNQKAFCLHKLKFEEGYENIRIAYYMKAHKPRMKGKWAYGQFAPMMTKDELEEIIKQMKIKNWI